MGPTSIPTQMSYQSLHIKLEGDDHERFSTLAIVSGPVTITLRDSYLWPSAEQVAAGDWKTGDGYLCYSQAERTLTWYSPTAASSIDTYARAVYQGEDADYLVSLMVILHDRWVAGPGDHPVPVFPSRLGVALTVSEEVC